MTDLTDHEALTTTKEMLTSATDLDIILGLLSDHYGIEVLVLPENVDRLAVVTLANWVHDASASDNTAPVMGTGTAKVRCHQLARFVLDLMADHRAPEAK